MVASPLQIASKSFPPTVSGEKIDTKRMAIGPPITIPNVPVKNIMSAFLPKLAMAFKSILKVISTKAAGNRYLLAIKYKLERLSEIISKLTKNDGSK